MFDLVFSLLPSLQTWIPEVTLGSHSHTFYTTAFPSSLEASLVLYVADVTFSNALPCHVILLPCVSSWKISSPIPMQCNCTPNLHFTLKNSNPSDKITIIIPAQVNFSLFCRPVQSSPKQILSLQRVGGIENTPR